MNNDASLRLLDRDADVLPTVIRSLQHLPEPAERLRGFGDHPLPVVHPYEDAAGAVGIGLVTDVYQDAVEAGHSEEPRKVALAESVHPGVFPLAELRRLHLHRHGVYADGDGGLVLHLVLLDLGQRPGLLESPVLVLHRVAEPQAVDIEVADGVGVLLPSPS